MEAHKMIELNKVCFSYLKGEEIFQDFSLKIDKGAHAIVGASGCGKSTLLKLLLGEIKPSSGSINVAGTLVSSLKSYRNIADFRRSKIGYVEQEPRFIDELDALTNVALAAALNSNEIKTAKKTALDLLKYVGVRPEQNVTTLSGGQAGRVAICRALINNPEVILADEPSSALDRETANQIIDLLFTQSLNRCLVIVTHDIEIAERCDTITKIG